MLFGSCCPFDQVCAEAVVRSLCWWFEEEVSDPHGELRTEGADHIVELCLLLGDG